MIRPMIAAPKENSAPHNAINGETRAITAWLFICSMMIAVMVVIGGLTRLTHSGLSIVEWRPITGILPPLSASDWEILFKKYQQYPEFRLKNPAMDLNGFKSIFWLEFIHRLWGRFIGVIFLVPLLFFALKKKLDRRRLKQLAMIFMLGGLQGFLGWFMVKSGLSERADVSHYRLAAHLGLACLLYGWIFWMALESLFPTPHPLSKSVTRHRHLLSALIAFLAVTILSGSFVAGSDAGFIYNTFPLMGNTLLPKDLFVLTPLADNFLNNVVTIQFTHRILTAMLLIAVAGFWGWIVRQSLPIRTRVAAHLLLAAVILQVILGVSTLLMMVPVTLAATHQAGALLVLSTMLWVRHELRA